MCITAHVAAGQEVLVAVKTIPGTGFHWVVRTVSGIKALSSDFPTRKVDSKHPLVGVPVIRVYHLTAVKARSQPYVVRLVELSPAGQPSGATVVVTIITRPSSLRS
jgi:predicted secreted protein